MRQLPPQGRMRNAPRPTLVLRCAMELHQANGNWITVQKKGTVSGSSEINHDNRDSGNRPLPVVPYLSRFSASASVR